MTTRTTAGRTLRSIAAVAVAALITAACGGDEAVVSEPATTTATAAPTTTSAPDTTTTAVAGADTTTTVAAAPDQEPETTTETTLAPATTTLAEADDAQMAEPEEITEDARDEVSEPDTDTGASEDGVAGRALTFLAGELGVPASEVTLTGAEPVGWPDASLGCPKEGYGYAQVLTPGFRFTFSHGTASHDVHTNADGTNLVRPLGCYNPGSGD